MTSQLIHPELLDMLSVDFFPLHGKIQEATETQSTTGQAKPAWNDVEAWTNIPCRVSPMGGGERRYATQTYVDATDVALLAGTFTGLTEKMRFVVDERIYDILHVETDSEGVTTRLTLRTVR